MLFNLEYWASAVDVVSSNPCVGTLPRIKILLILLSICTDELISTPKIMTFIPTLPSDNENSERNRIQYHKHYIYNFFVDQHLHLQISNSFK